MYRKAVIFLSFLVVANCVPQDLDALVDDVFKKPSANNGNTAANNQPNKPCTTDTISNGECVPYYLCNENNSINSDGVGIIDIRINEEGPCVEYMDVCCGVSDITDKPHLPSTPPTPVQRSVSCGYRNVDGVGFRIKGDKDNEAKFGEFPWMVAILREEPVATSGQKLNVYICGGSLIHPKVVLTAAHCVVPRTGSQQPKLKIRAGEWDTQTKNEIFPHQDRNVVKIVTHEQYYAGALFNDIAVLILETPVDLIDNVGIVCLPPALEEPPPSRCFVSGWGKDVFGKEGKYQVILKAVELPIVERRKCQTNLRKTRLGNRFELHRTFICAGGEKGKDACKGDGGSPLVCPVPGKPGHYMQSGIVAWGIGCGDSDIPGVYAHVGALREWIDEQMIYNNIDLAPYAP